MRSSKNKNRNKTRIQNQSSVYRGRVGRQRMIRKTKFKTNSQTRYFNAASQVNRNTNNVSNTQYQQRQNRQNKLFQKNAVQFSNSVSSMRRAPVRMSPYASVSSEINSSSSVGPVVRGRLKSNFGFMRSDSITQKQRIRRELEDLQQRQPKQRQWLNRSMKQMMMAASSEQPQKNNSARTAVYDPSSTVTVFVPNSAGGESSDVTVVFGKMRKKSRNQNARRISGQQAAQMGGNGGQKEALEEEDDVANEHGDSLEYDGSYPEIDVLVV